MPENSLADQRAPLSGIRVIEVGNYMAGPFCGMQLADLGAEVIKVEHPDGGDQVRSSVPLINGEGSAFMRLNRNKRSVALGGRPVSLTPREFELLRVLAQNEGKLMTHPSILREVWGPAYGGESHYLHVYISQLRRKIETDPARPRYLLTEAGAGYRLVSP